MLLMMMKRRRRRRKLPIGKLAHTSNACGITDVFPQVKAWAAIGARDSL